MASKYKCGEESGATAFCSESNQKGTNILVVKGTTHTGKKDVCKSHRDNFSQFWRTCHLKKSQPFSGSISLQIDCSYLGGIDG